MIHFLTLHFKFSLSKNIFEHMFVLIDEFNFNLQSILENLSRKNDIKIFEFGKTDNSQVKEALQQDQECDSSNVEFIKCVVSQFKVKHDTDFYHHCLLIR